MWGNKLSLRCKDSEHNSPKDALMLQVIWRYSLSPYTPREVLNHLTDYKLN